MDINSKKNLNGQKLIKFSKIALKIIVKKNFPKIWKKKYFPKMKIYNHPLFLINCICYKNKYLNNNNFINPF